VHRQRYWILEVPLQLDIPQSVVLPDGKTAIVRGVAAQVIDGKLDQIVYTVEKESGAWMKVTSGELDTQRSLA
jgi:hypothetical protein